MGRLLVIDDDFEFLNMMVQGLRLNNFEVVTSQDPVDAIRLISEFPFDGILTDLDMPRISGIQMISYIKASEKNRETPIFVISGQDLTSPLLASLNVVEFLTKPISIRNLAQKLRQRLNLESVKKRLVAYAPELVAIFKSSAHHILSYYAGYELSFAPAYIKTHHKKDADHYGMITLFGKRMYGSLALAISNNILEAILIRLFTNYQMNQDQDQSLLRETFLEIINQIAGKFKLDMANFSVACNIGLPEYLTSEVQEYRHKVSGHVLCLPLKAGEENIRVELCLGALSMDQAIEDNSFELFLTAS